MHGDRKGKHRHLQSEPVYVLLRILHGCRPQAAPLTIAAIRAVPGFGPIHLLTDLASPQLGAVPSVLPPWQLTPRASR